MSEEKSQQNFRPASLDLLEEQIIDWPEDPFEIDEEMTNRSFI